MTTCGTMPELGIGVGFHMALTAGTLVTVAFPLTELSAVKRRPALVLVPAGEDLILCGVTSHLSRRADALVLDQGDMIEGRLPKRSEIRPLKIFTIHRSLVHRIVGRIKKRTLASVVDLLVAALKSGTVG